MKKIISLVLVAVLLLASLCACSNGGTKEKPTGPEETPKLYFTFAKDCVGYNLEQTCNILSISEEDLVSEFTAEYQFVQKTLYKGVEFTKYLEFDRQSGLLYGGRYKCVLSKTDAQLAELIASIMADLTEDYGAPTTYPGLRRISEQTDFSKISNTSIKEDWTIPEEATVTLSMLFYGESDVEVQLDYVIDRNLWFQIIG